MAASRKSYYRSYIILKEEMKGYASEEREPSGYCKIEVRGGKGKAHIYVQGLKQLPPNSVYKAYFITCQRGKNMGVYATLMDVDSHGKAERKWGFDPDNVGDSGYSIEDFDVMAVLVKQQGESSHGLLCPLAGYRDKECSWKNGYEEFQKQEMDSKKVEEKTEEKTEQEVSTEEISPVISPEKKQVDEAHIEEIEKEKGQILRKTEEKEVSLEFVEEEAINTERVEVEEAKGLKESQVDDEEIQEYQEEGHENQYENQYNNLETPKYQEDYEAYEQYKKEMNLNFEEEWGEWEPEEFRDSVEETSLDSEENQIVNEMFDTYPQMNPFENPMEDWTWIRISVRDLTALPISIWRMMNNPFVLISYKRYHHLLLGRKQGKMILGIPNIYHPREKNIAYIHGFSKFICCQDVKPRAGEYGYWVVEME